MCVAQSTRRSSRHVSQASPLPPLSSPCLLGINPRFSSKFYFVFQIRNRFDTPFQARSHGNHPLMQQRGSAAVCRRLRAQLPCGPTHARRVSLRTIYKSDGKAQAAHSGGHGGTGAVSTAVHLITSSSLSSAYINMLCRAATATSWAGALLPLLLGCRCRCSAILSWRYPLTFGCRLRMYPRRGWVSQM